MIGFPRHLYGILNRETFSGEGYFLPSFFKGYDNFVRGEPRA